MSTIYLWVKALIKAKLRKIRAWINGSSYRCECCNCKTRKIKANPFVLGLMVLIIGYTGCFIHEHYEDFQIVKTIEIKIADAYQESPAPAGGIQAPATEGPIVSAPASPQYFIGQYDWDVKVATAIFKTESGMNEKAMNWNCRYGGVSKQCRPEDRDQAWSVDCGIAQINVAGKVCPEELFNPEKNIAQAYAMYKKRGFQPWVSYVNDYHLVNL